jgi:glycerol-3-phosphate acyltransferase PlsY
MLFVIVIFAGYLIGSFPSAVWIGKIFHNLDIREHGSHNAGATNTFRVLGKRWGWLVLALDVGKGFLAASVPFFLSSLYLGFKDEVLILQLMASFFAILGHVFPILANFRGGKGVATTLGIILSINLDTALICLGIFLIVFLLSKFVSLGAIVASFFFPLSAFS